MPNLLDAFKKLSGQLQTYMGWDASRSRIFVNNIINNYVVDLSSLNLDINDNFDSSSVNFEGMNFFNLHPIKSQLLYSQLTNLALNAWTIQLPLDPPDTGDTTTVTRTLTSGSATQNGQRIIQIAVQTGRYEDYSLYNVEYGHPTNKIFQTLSPTIQSIAQIFVGNLAHELGHAQDHKLNSINYVGDPTMENALSIGARVAQKLIGEGKALANNINAAMGDATHPALDIPVTGSKQGIKDELIGGAFAAEVIMAGANTFYNFKTSGTSNTYINQYWNEVKTTFNDSQPVLANKNVLDALNNLNMTQVRPPVTDTNGVVTNYVTFSQSAGATEEQKTITMSVTFNDGSSYINTFGGYGAITLSDTNSGNVTLTHGTSPSPPNVATGQRFNYVGGNYLSDDYNLTINGVSYSEAVQYFTKNGNNLYELKYGQYDRVINGVLNVDLKGDGAVATLSNVASITLESGAKATVFGTNNTITLNGNNTLKIGVDAAHPNVFGNTHDVIKNFNTSDKIELVGVTGIIGKPFVDANNVLTVHTSNHGVAQDITVQFSASPYVQYMDFSKDFNSGTQISAAMKAGFHIVQSNETAASIAANYGLSASVLTKINSVFPDADFNVGGVVRVPLSSGSANHLGPLPSGQTYVYNPERGTAFVVASRLDGLHDGSLIVDPTINSPVFERGTYSSVSQNNSTGDITVGLTAQNGASIGSLVFNLTSNSGQFILPSGYSVPVYNISALNLNAFAASSAVDVAVNYLSQFGTQVSQQQLKDLNDNYLNPTGSGYAVAGNVVNTSQPGFDGANEIFNAINSAPGAIIHGSNTVVITNYISIPTYPYSQPIQVTVTPTHYLNASGNISQDDISNIEVLNIVGNQITLNADQLASFTVVNGTTNSTTVTAASSGTYDFRASNISGTFNSITATSWNGTTIYGNNQNGQVLRASAFGNDTLVAGDGANDKLYAGSGINTLIGGSGDDTFYAKGGLAAGSVVQGHGGNNTLYADGNIAGASISGVQTLNANGFYLMPDFTVQFLSGSVTLNNSSFNSFNSIEAYNITTASGGVYNFNGKVANTVNVTIGSNAGTEIIANGYTGNTIKASAFGNDTLIGVANSSITLNADDSHGNNTLVSDGNVSTLSADNSTGDNHLTGNGDGYLIMSADGSTGNNVLTSNSNGYDTISADDSTGNNILSAISGMLRADYSSGDNSLTISNGTASANGSDGNNTFNVANGSAYANGSTGNNQFNVTTGTANAIDSDGNNVFNVSQGSASANDSFGDNTFNIINGSAYADRSIGNNLFNITTGSVSANDSDGNNVFNISQGSVTAYDSFGNNTFNIINGNVFADGASGNNTINITSGNANADNSDGNNLFNVTTGSVSANNSFGNNTINVGVGSASANGSYGDNHLTTGDGTSELSASGSFGDNHLTAGDGNHNLSVFGSSGNNTLVTHDTAATSTQTFFNNRLNAYGSSGDNTLTAGDGNYDYLEASSSSGNNILTVGNGNYNYIVASESLGNNILNAGAGSHQYINISNSSGNNSVTTNGSDSNIFAQNSSGNNSINISGSNNSVYAATSHGNNILTAGVGGHNRFDISNSTGNNMLTADGDNSYLTAYNSSGNNTLKALGGNNSALYVVNSSGDNTLMVGDGSGNSLWAGGATGHNSFIVGNGDNNAVYVGTSLGNVVLGTGNNNLVFAELGLASGLSITSQNYTTSVLQANGDISGATISGFANLTGVNVGPNEISGVKLNATELAGFKSINVGNLYAATDGTYDLTGKGSGQILHATATTGTTLIAGTQQSLVASSAGNDTLIANGSNDILDANNTSGNNTLTANGSGNTLTANNSLGNNFLSAGTDGNNHLSVLNSAGNNTLIVTGGVMNSLDATGSTGHNILDASGASSGSLFATSSYLHAGDGGDILIGGAGTDNIAGGAGNDTITGNGGADYIDAGAGDDTVTYDQLSAFISGGTGNDTLLLSQATATTIELGNAISQINSSGQVSSFENIDGSGSSASLNITGDANANVLKGGSDNDIINGGVGADTISGGAGDDTIIFNAASISIDGGIGNDNLILQGSSAVSVNLSSSANQVTGNAVITGFENIDGSAATGVLSLTGDDGDNILKAGSGADSIYAGAGNDTAIYDDQDLIADGGDGNDTLVLNQSVATTVNLGSIISQVAGGGTIINFENIDGASSTADLIMIGDANANTLIGGSGNDIVSGGAGADTISSGAGNDTITYDFADISVDGGIGVDTLVVDGNATFIADMSNVSNQVIGAGIITGFENIDASAGAADVSLTGNDVDNILKGGSGADSIYGGSGNDTITYDANDIIMDGGSGNDTLILNRTSPTTVNIASVVNQVIGGGTAIDFENIDGSASTAALNVTGDVNANIIKGGSGNDTLYSGGGGDSIYGNAGNDIITFNSADLVEDGGAGNDTLIVSQGAFTINIGNPSGQIFINAALNQYIAGFETIDASASTGSLFISGVLNGSTVKGGFGSDQYNFTDTALTGTIIGGGGTDVLQVNGDITGATISGINTLLSLGGVRLTASQLAGFNFIGSGSHLYAATGGTYDMTGRGTTGDTLEATVNTGTTLIAGATSGQTLIASEFGTDTLTIGNGDNDVVIAGKGINYITMGTGNNDVIIANNGLAAGSTVLAKNTTTSKLQVNGDISGASITGVNTISSATGVTLTSAQLAGLKFVANNSILYAATGGTYSLNGGRGSFGNQLHATVNTGTTLIAGNAQSMSLYASAFGNDTLTIGTGNNDTVYAGGGINIITLGNGTGDRVIAAQGLAAGSSVTMGNTADSLLLAEGNISGATLTGIHTLGSTGGVTLNATQLNNFATINANTILNAATGGTYNLTGKGDVGGTLRATVNTGTTLIGGADNQTLIASVSGADTLIAGNGNNVTLIGGNGGNTLTGGNGVNTISGGSGNDIIVGGLAADIISAGSGNDTVTYDANDASEDGGAGVDTLILNGNLSITANLGNASNQITGSTIVTGFENLDGSAATAALSLIGDAGANILIGGSGNDALVGGGGADSLFGNGGDDSITYNAAATIMDGGAGNNTLVLNQTIATTVDLTNTLNAVVGGGTAINFENIDGSASTAALTITGDANANVLKGGVGDDIINGGAGADTISGGGGNDSVIYDTGDVSIDGGAGTDTLVLNGTSSITANLANSNQVTGSALVTGFENIDASAITAAVSLTGDAGNNILKGGSAADTVSGGDGNDTITYDALDTSVDGGLGNDTLVFSGAAAVTSNLASTIDQISGGGKAINFENLDASLVTANVNFTGSVSANVLIGGSGNDTINGGVGADSLYGNAGNDTITYDSLDTIIFGGAGIDTLVVAGASAVAINLANIADQVSGDAGIATGFEYVSATALTGDLTLTGDAVANNLKGGSGANTINAGAGNDTITGGVGNDNLYGEDGNDVINGGIGVDSIYGGAGNDTITYNVNAAVLDGGDGIDTLVLSGSDVVTIDFSNAQHQVSSNGIVSGFEYINGAGLTSDLTLTGDDAANNLRGGAGANTIYGLGGNDTITGGISTDTLYGGDGNDSIVGGGDADSLYGEAGNDTITYDANDVVIDGGAGVDTLVMTGSAALTIDLTSAVNQISGSTTVTGFENITATNYTGDLTIFGNDSTNTLRGGSGVNTIYGSASNDSITGGTNTDTLYGGDGNDSIVGGVGADNLYGEAGNDSITYDAADTVIDGGAGLDTLVLTGLAALTIDLSNTTSQITGSAVVTNFENITATNYTGDLTITGSDATNTLRGGSGLNTITGGNSNDSITGGANADTLSGGDGNDTIIGGLGADRIYGGAGNDSITYDAADTIIDGGADIDTLAITGSLALTIDLSNSVNQIAGSAVVTNFENITATNYTGALTIAGSGVANTLRGGSGVNTIIGGSGNDAITGGTNNDMLTGGQGNDTLTGGLGNDTYNFARGDGADVIAENDATVDNHDVLAFASGVNYDQLWFKKSGNNLIVDVIGTTDRVTVSNWFLSTDRQVEAIQAGGQELVNSSVINLVNAMAGMTAPAAGQTTLTTAQHTALDPVIAANWHAA